MNISVVIPVKDGGEIFEECIGAICSAKNIHDEIIIVDDGSTSTIPAEIARKQLCTLITLPHTTGPANARNVGVESAKGEIILFLDSDVIVQPDIFDKIRILFTDDSICGAVGVLRQDIRFNNFCSQFKNLWMRYTYSRLPERVALFYTSCATIRKNVFLQSGGFDVGYKRPSVEDTDFGQKLAMKGYPVHLRRDIEVEHVKSYTLYNILKTDLYRSSDMVKMTLRNGIKKMMRGNTTSVPSSFIWSVVLFVVMLVGGGITLLQGSIATPVGFFLVSLVSFSFLNISFLSWLYHTKGLIFTVLSLLFLYLSVPIVAFGVFHGVTSFIFGKRY